MPYMIPLRKIILQRGKDAQRIEPPIGKPFDFTKEEIEELKKQSSPTRQLIRAPKNEMADIEKETDGDDTKTTETAPPATKSSRSRSAANKTDDL